MDDDLVLILLFEKREIKGAFVAKKRQKIH